MYRDGEQQAMEVEYLVAGEFWLFAEMTGGEVGARHNLHVDGFPAPDLP